MTSNEHGIVYSGTWEQEGHTVSFMLTEQGDCKISEAHTSSRWANRGYSLSRTVSIDDAIEEQEQLIKFGYDKVS